MGILLDIIFGIISINILWIGMFVVAHWYYKIKARRAGKKIQNSTAPEPTVSEPSSEPDTGISTYLLAIENYGASIIRLGEDGWVTAQTYLGDAENEVEAEVLAKQAGWRVEGDWSAEADINTVSVVPKLAAASFVASSEIEPEKALFMAKLAGMTEVVSVVKQEVLADDGKVVVYFSVGIPQGWVDSEIVAWA